MSTDGIANEIVNMQKSLADAIDRNFTSPNVPDSNLENANIVDVLNDAVNKLDAIAVSIGSGLGDIADQHKRIADAIFALAEAVKDHP